MFGYKKSVLERQRFTNLENKMLLRQFQNNVTPFKTVNTLNISSATVNNIIKHFENQEESLCEVQYEDAFDLLTLSQQ